VSVPRAADSFLAVVASAVQERYRYSPYGAVTVLDADFSVDADGKSDIGNSVTYTGRQLDAETGLYYYRNRHYHAQLGGFISRDPIDYTAGDPNLYRYVASNPVSRIDPYGFAGSVTMHMVMCNKIPPLTEELIQLRCECFCNLIGESESQECQRDCRACSDVKKVATSPTAACECACRLGVGKLKGVDDNFCKKMCGDVVRCMEMIIKSPDSPITYCECVCRHSKLAGPAEKACLDACKSLPDKCERN
jgi:RHS repeat-associated protein